MSPPKSGKVGWNREQDSPRQEMIYHFLSGRFFITNLLIVTKHNFRRGLASAGEPTSGNFSAENCRTGENYV